MAIDVAIQMIHENPDYKVTMSYVVKDSGVSTDDSDADTALDTAVTNLVDTENVQAIVGALRSSKSKRIAAQIAGLPDDIVQVSAASTSNQLSDKNTYPSFFRTVPNDDAQVDAMIELLEDWGVDKVGMIYTTDAYAGTLATTFNTKWLAKGYTLSPSWEDSPSFTIGTGAANAASAINTIKTQGTSTYNLISVGETNDVEALMRAADAAGMVGEGFVWGGFDVFASSVNAASDADLIQMFEGTVGTNIKFASVTNPLFLDFASKWADMAENGDVASVPWAKETNVLSLMPYTAQMYDAIAILAQAATNYANAGGSGVIDRATLFTYMKKADLVTPGIGNIDGDNNFSFDTTEGGYDGFKSYEILNWVGNQWVDVGDWISGGTGYEKKHDILFPGGKSTAPPQDRSPKKALKVGVLFPIGTDMQTTEGYSSLYALGMENYRGLQVAASMINNNDDYSVSIELVSASSGIDAGRELSTDAGFLGSQLKTGLDELKNQDVKVIIGALRSSRSIPAAKYCAQNGIAQISHASTSNKLSDKSTYPNFFRVVPNDDYQSKALKSLLKEWGVTKVGLVYTTDDYAQGLCEAFRDTWLADGNSLSPTWSNTYSFPMGAANTVVSGAKTHADLAIERIMTGKSYYNIFCGITDDSESLMAAAHKAGATAGSSGENWVWLGADGFVTANPVTDDLQNAFQDAIGTNVKMGSDLNGLYLDYVNQWRTDVDEASWPWKDTNVIGFSPFTAQVYDALAIAAEAASAFYTSSTGQAASVISNQQMIDALKATGLSTKGIGNVDTNGDFTFDTAEGGYDGPKSYEIMNYRGDLWADVGDWFAPDTLNIVDRLQFPSGINPPPQYRNEDQVTMKVGVILPQAASLGVLKDFGDEGIMAIKVAIQMIQENPDYKVSISYVVKDSGQSTDANAVDTELTTAVTDLVDTENVQAIIGALRSSKSKRIAAQIADLPDNIVQVSGASTSNTLSDKTTYPSFFRTVPNDDAQVDAMIELLEDWGVTKVGMIYTTDAYAGSLANTFKEKWLAKDYTFSPSWDDSPSFTIGTGADNAAAAISTIQTKGTSAYNLISVGETNDVEALMRAADAAGLIGEGFVWGGFDVFASSVNAASDDDLIQMFEGTVGTNVKFASVNNPLFLDFASKWAEMFEDGDIASVPWAQETNILSLLPYSAQMYDVIAILAQAATNFANDGGSGAIDRATLFSYMTQSDLMTPGIGNVDGDNNFKFDTTEGGYDGFKSYEILNWVGDQWLDVGDWISGGTGYEKKHTILFPGGKSTPPPQNRSPKKLLKVGVLFPTGTDLSTTTGYSGLYALGMENYRGLQVAANMINSNPDYSVSIELVSASSGIDAGRELGTNAGFSGSQLEEGLTDLVNQDVKVIIGALRSSRSIPAAKYCAQNGIAQISHASTSNKLSDKVTYPNFFRVVPNDDYQSKALKSLLKTWGVTKVGLVYTTDDYAQGLCEAFRDTWLADGNSLSPTWSNTYNFPMGEAETVVAGGKTHADLAVEKIMSGTSYYNIFCGITDDSESLMAAAEKAGATASSSGENWVWLGADGFVTANPDTAELQNAFQDAVGTNVKMGSDLNDLYLAYLNQWRTDIDSQYWPWKDSNVIALSPFTAQAYDALAIAAEAATAFYTSSTGLNADVISKQQMIDALKTSGLSTKGIGNVDTNGVFTFDQDEGGYDGPKSYEIMNYRGDLWADVGDWFAPDSLHIIDRIQFPSGVNPPAQARNEGQVTMKVGVILPQKESLGTLKSFGDEGIMAIDVAIQMIQENPDYKVSISYVVKDSGDSTDANAVDTELTTAVNDLVNTENVHAIIGALRSSKSKRIAAQIADLPDDIVQVSGASTSNSLSDKTTYPSFFRTVPNDDAQVDAMIELLEDWGVDKVGMIYTTDAYAGSLAQTFNEKWTAKGYTLSPSWEDSPSFTIGTGADIAADAINAIKTQGTSNYNLISVGETNDVEALMRAAKTAGMIGEGFVWGGFDVFASSVNAASDDDLIQIFEGTVGTNVKYASVTNPLFLDFASKWSEMEKDGDVTSVPWADETNVLSLLPYTAQMYDVIAILAQAATNYANDGGSGVIDRATLFSYMTQPDLITPGIGNVDGDNNFKFDITEGGYDGFKSYEILNWVGDQWLDVGDWISGGTGYEKKHTILFPGGQSTPPPQNRSPKKALKVGVLFPTGTDMQSTQGYSSLYALGMENYRGLQVAANMINSNPEYSVSIQLVSASSGIDAGRDLSSTAGFSGSQLEAGLKELKDQDVKVIIGALRSSRSIPAAKYCAQNGIAQISHASTSNKLSDKSTYPNFFRVVPNDDYQSKALKSLLKEWGVTKVGLVYTTDDYAQGLCEAFRDTWLADGYSVSPTWGDTYSFPMGEAEMVVTGGKTHADLAIEKIMTGKSYYNIFCGIADDSESLMAAAHKAGATAGSSGENWVWLGADGFVTANPDTDDLQNAFQDAIGTNVKMGSDLNPLYLSYLNQWQTDVDEAYWPWKDTKVIGLSPFTAQAYDALAIAAEAASAFYTSSTGMAASVISNQQMIDALKASGLSTKGIGNVDTNGIFTFDTAEGGYDGPKSYEIMNYRGDLWADVGDWFAPDSLNIVDRLQFPSGINPPPQYRNEDQVTMKVGVILPQKESLGTLKSFGDEGIMAIDVAIQMIQENPDYKVSIEYVVKDSGDSTAANAVDTELTTAVTDLVDNENVQAIIGALRSSKSKRIATQIAGLSDDIVQVSGASTSNSLSDKDTYPSFFRTVPNDDAQVDAMIDLLEDWGVDKVGMIYTTDAYAGSLAHTFNEKWIAKGYTLSPSWEDSPSFTIGTGAEKAAAAIDTIKTQGTSYYNLISVGETNDVEALMRAAKTAGMIGEGFVWGGFDVFASSVNAASDDDLIQIFEGTVGTNVKYASVTNPLFLDFASKWSEMAVNGDVTSVPWAQETNILSLLPYTAQMYDVIAILAQAATNYANDGGSGVIDRATLFSYMKQPDLITPGIGNVDGDSNFKFDTTEGGYDGFKSYEILNWVGDQWLDVGDWISGGTGYEKKHTILFPGGKSIAPPQDRAPKKALKVGVLFPTGTDMQTTKGYSGLYALGMENYRGLQVAANMINNNDDYSVSIELVSASSGIDADRDLGTNAGFSGSQLEAGLNELKNQDVKVIIGGLRSSRSIPAAKFCTENGIAQISHASTSNKLSDKVTYPNFFRVVPNDDYQSTALKSLLKSWDVTKVGLVYTTDDYAQGLCEAFKDTWLTDGNSLSPTWDNTYSFPMGEAETAADADGGKTHAELAIERIMSGTSYYNIFCGITDDSISLMAAAAAAGATATTSGENWVWLGADGFVTANPDTVDLQNAFQDAVGTNVKMGSDLNPLYIDYIEQWNTDVEQAYWPWKDTKNIGFSPFTAQAYDALAIAAQAATVFYNSNEGLNAGVISNQQMIDALKTSGLSTKGIGNVDADNVFTFDTDEGGYDGPKSYEIMNYRGDLWADVGDWSATDNLNIVDRIQFPSGVNPPDQDRSPPPGFTTTFTTLLAGMTSAQYYANQAAINQAFSVLFGGADVTTEITTTRRMLTDGLKIVVTVNSDTADAALGHEATISASNFDDDVSSAVTDETNLTVTASGVSDPETKAAETEVRIKVGIILPQKDTLGTLKAFGDEGIMAIDVAIQMIKENPDYKVSISYVVKDSGDSTDAGDADTELVTAVTDLVDNENVQAIIGALRSSKSKRIAAEIASMDDDIVQISGASTSNSLSDKDTYPSFFRTVPNDDAQVDAMIDLLKDWGVTEVGMIYTTDAYAGSLALTFKEKWTAEGYTFSPSWDDSPSFTIGTGAANAASAISTIQTKGTSAYNLISVGETNDVEALMRAANAAGLIGEGFVWGGFDVFASSVNAASDDDLIQIFEGTVGTNVKFASVNNPLFLDFASKWAEMADDGDVASVPWAQETNVLSLLPYTAQMYDVVAILAQAATNYANNGGSGTIDRATLFSYMTQPDLITPGIGNIDGDKNFKFDTSENGYDGFKSYEILNWVGDQWLDVGDWKSGGTGLEKKHAILFPGGKATPPPQKRSPKKLLKVGVLFPTGEDLSTTTGYSGLYALGMENYKGLEVAAKMINNNPDYSVSIQLVSASSGIDAGRDLSTDAGFSGSQLEAGLNSLVAEDVQVIIGALRSSRSIPAAKFCAQSSINIAQISHASTSNKLSDKDTYQNFFRVVPNDDYQSTALKSLLKSWGVTKVGLVYTTDDYAQGLCEAFKKTWLEDGNSLSPSWENTYSFAMGDAETVVSDGKTHADLAIERIVSGESYYNIFCGITDDSESLMKAAAKAGATFTSSGNSWVWLGADGFVTASPEGELQNAFQDAVGTNVRMGSDLNDLYIDYIQGWRDHVDSKDYPWAGNNVIGFSPFTAQAYDALAVAAEAATAFYNSDAGLAAEVITSQQLITALKATGLSTKGIGNVDADGVFEFDTEAGGFDGRKSYEIMNYRGDLWADVGDWYAPDTLHIVDRIQFPTGITPPSQDRNAGEGTKTASPETVEKEVEKETIPVWLIIILVLLGVCLLIVGGLFCYAYSKQGKHLFENLQDEEEKVDEIELRAPKRKGYQMDEGGADTGTDDKTQFE